MTAIDVQVLTPIGPAIFTGTGNADLTASSLSSLLIAGNAISLTVDSDGITIASTFEWTLPAAPLVGDLPAAGEAGRVRYVTDATAPTFLGVAAGGGAVVCPVFDDGTNWVTF